MKCQGDRHVSRGELDVGLEEEGTKGVEYDVILEGLGSVINFDNHFRRVMVAGLRRQSYCSQR